MKWAIVQQVPETDAAPGAAVPGRLGSIAAAIWIVGGSVYFFVNFSLVFYASHEAGIDATVRRIGEGLGLR